VLPKVLRSVAQTVSVIASAFYVKIPVTDAGLIAFEEAIFAGVPINVMLLFSSEQYLAAAEAYLRGIERRIDAGLNPNIASVASVFVRRWDSVVRGKVPDALQNRLGIAIARKYTKNSAVHFLTTIPARVQFRRTPAAAALGQHGHKRSEGARRALRRISVRSLHGKHVPDATLKAFAEHVKVPEELPAKENDFDQILDEFAHAGVDVDALAAHLQEEGAEAFAKSWGELMDVIDSKSMAMAKVG
jgi:transaldolase